MIYLQLFLAFLQIGAFSFGGGYAAMPLIQDQVIDKYHWLAASDFADLVTIAEMTPGPIAINAASFVGNQVGGIGGALVATLGVTLPSCIFVSILAWAYNKYRKMAMLQGILKSLRPAVVAMILAAGLNILLPTLFGEVDFMGILKAEGWESLRQTLAAGFQPWMFLWFVLAFVILRSKKTGPIQVMVGCGVAQLLLELIRR